MMAQTKLREFFCFFVVLLLTVLSTVSGFRGISLQKAYSLALKNDGSVLATGSNMLGQFGDGSTASKQTFENILFAGIKAVFAGDGYSMVIKTDDSLWATGRNLYGQLGDG